MHYETPSYRTEFGAAHDSASGGTQEPWEYVLKLYTRHLGVRLPMAARPWCGIVVQDGANLILGLDKYQPMVGQQDGMDQARAIAQTMEKYNSYQPRQWDGGKVAHRPSSRAPAQWPVKMWPGEMCQHPFPCHRVAEGHSPGRTRISARQKLNPEKSIRLFSF